MAAWIERKGKRSPGRPRTRQEGPEQGAGVHVRAEISVEAHAQLRLELVRRRLNGQPCTAEDLIRELIDDARPNWPSIN